MKRLIENAPKMWGILMIILLLTLTFVAENGAVEVFRTNSFQTSYPPQPSSADPYQWIKVLEPSEQFQIILIDKSSQTVDVLEHENGSFNELASYDCATGENSGKKLSSGDLRTPEGIYFITESFTDDKITIFGKRAFHLDYPNVFDKSEKRNGDGIYIHGTNKKLIPNSTNGCITMQNKDLDLLSQLLIAHNTPIIIVNDKSELQNLAIDLSGIGQDTILSLLVPDEISQNELIIHNLFVISNGTQNVAVGKFDVSGNNYRHKTVFSRVYLNKDENSNWIIDKRIFRGPMVRIEPIQKKIRIAKIQIAETTKTIAKTTKKGVPDSQKTIPAPSAPKTTSKTAKTSNKVEPENQKTIPALSGPKTNDQILSFIEKWRQAWQNKQLDDYIDCYAENFQQGRKNLRAWRKHKENLNRKYKTIRVDVNDIQIDWQKNGAKVQFHQVYKSDKFFADGKKELILIHTEKGWQILREIWQN